MLGEVGIVWPKRLTHEQHNFTPPLRRRDVLAGENRERRARTADERAAQNMEAMKERPIIFSAPMVQAILEGRKTQTRRIVKPDIANFLEDGWGPSERMYETRDGDIIPAASLCPYGKPGDRLWVRETWQPGARDIGMPEYAYRADGEVWYDGRWRASIHMPRVASRILLEITDIRVERLHEITEEDAIRECAEYGYIDIEGKLAMPDEETERLLGGCGSYRQGFIHLWQSIHGPESLSENPWVWVIAFKKIQP